MTYLCGSLAFLFFFVLIVYFQKLKENKGLRVANETLTHRFDVISKQMVDFSALNNHCMEKWEKSALEVKNLNNSNAQLIKLVQDLEDQLEKSKK